MGILGLSFKILLLIQFDLGIPNMRFLLLIEVFRELWDSILISFEILGDSNFELWEIEYGILNLVNILLKI